MMAVRALHGHKWLSDHLLPVTAAMLLHLSNEELNSLIGIDDSNELVEDADDTQASVPVMTKRQQFSSLVPCKLEPREPVAVDVRFAFDELHTVLDMRLWLPLAFGADEYTFTLDHHRVGCVRVTVTRVRDVAAPSVEDMALSALCWREFYDRNEQQQQPFVMTLRDAALRATVLEQKERCDSKKSTSASSATAGFLWTRGDGSAPHVVWGPSERRNSSPFVEPARADSFRAYFETKYGIMCPADQLEAPLWRALPVKLRCQPRLHLASTTASSPTIASSAVPSASRITELCAFAFVSHWCPRELLFG